MLPRDSGIAYARFGLPAGNAIAGLAVLMCVVLVTQVDHSQFLIVASTIPLGFLNWVAVPNRKTTSPA
jgi:hypothetical protein